MYIPSYYKMSDYKEVTEFIQQNGFATLVSLINGRPWATHLPLLFFENTGKPYLTGHLSKANVQWHNFNQTDEVLAIFLGPNAYISSSWYDHENAPTWNYISIHIYGKIKILSDEKLKEQVSQLVDKYEKNMKNPISVHKMSPSFLESELKGIVGFEIQITAIHAASKLSQNRDSHNYDNILKELNEQGDSNSLEIKRLMELEKLKLF